MRRRTVLAAIGALAAASGCSRVLGEEPVRVRVKRASESRAENADTHCGLAESFVVDHPILERVMSSAKTAPVGEWVTTGTDHETGEAIVADLESHCDGADSVYHYDDEAFVVSVRKDGESMFTERTSPSSEAIRRARPDDTT
jgi:hypothetical protein